jgi:hypothetical protein
VLQEGGLDAEAKKLKLDCHNNLAAVNNKLKEHVEAVQECSRALTVDQENFKALLRRGQARVQLGQLRLALVDMEQVKFY